jgi:hypothetical protein
VAQEQIELDLDGKVIPVPGEIVSEIAAAAAARAGVSQRHRELSLHLNRALDSGHVTLGQAHIRALVAVLEEEHPERFGPAAAELRRSVA